MSGGSQSLILPYSLYMRFSAGAVIWVMGLLVFAQGLPGCRCEGGNNMQKQGDSLAWEQVDLLCDQKTFLKIAPPLAGVVDKMSPSDICGNQISLSVPDMDEKVIAERSGKGRTLTNCHVRSSIGTQTSTLLEIRGEFIDDRLSRASFRFKEDGRAQILSLLQKRFGPGDDIVLSEQDIFGQKDMRVHYWRDNNEIWLLGEPTSGTVLLIHQDLKSGATLPLPEDASKKGEPVNLDDIGIGKLDLNAPLPELDLPSDKESAATD